MSLEDKIEKLIKSIEALNSNIKNLQFIKPDQKSSEKLIPLTKWANVHEWPSISALRSIVFNEQYNGASSFIIRIGRRVYIDEARFFEWARSNPSTKIDNR